MCIISVIAQTHDLEHDNQELYRLCHIHDKQIFGYAAYAAISLMQQYSNLHNSNITYTS